MFVGLALYFVVLSTGSTVVVLVVEPFVNEFISIEATFSDDGLRTLISRTMERVVPKPTVTTDQCEVSPWYLRSLVVLNRILLIDEQVLTQPVGSVCGASALTAKTLVPAVTLAIDLQIMSVTTYVIMRRRRTRLRIP